MNSHVQRTGRPMRAAATAVSASGRAGGSGAEGRLTGDWAPPMLESAD
ncbi:hypothetical protein [Streptomyces neyagawaensis]|nr:hypothetical protein [Streptomyces neyagawaensis]MCL6735173.1 hypothetical protein [Streptomyces neyagawaensis]MDE1688455.1 hypothetical protein [Streptomyces neyagawaensis]